MIAWLVRAILAGELLAALAAGGCHIVIPAYQGQPGHPALLQTAILPDLLAFRGQGGLRGAIDAYAGPKVTLELPDPGLILDADDPAAYARLQAYHQGRG